MKTLTARQKEVLDFISSYLDQHSYPPTIREIAESFSISVKGGYDHVKALEKKGFLRLGENRSRALEILRRDKPERSVVELPLLGTVAAGKPITADENYSGVVHVPADIVRAAACFALSRARRQHERRRHLPRRHRRHRAAPDRGQRRDRRRHDRRRGHSQTLLRENNRVKLMAENPAYAPIYTQDVRILGRLCGIIRSTSRP